MKKSILAVSISLIVLLGLTAVAAGGNAEVGAWLDHKPESGAMDRLADLLRQLQLTEGQKAQLRQVWELHEQDLRQLIQKDLQGHLEIFKVVAQPAPDENAITSACADHAQAENQLAYERARLWSEAWPLLSETQQKTLTENAINQEYRLEKFAGWLNNSGCSPFVTQMKSTMVRHLADRFDLSDEQLEQLRLMRLYRQNELKKLEQERFAAKGVLRQIIRQPAYDPVGIDAASARLAEIEHRLIMEKAEIAAATGRILTPEQFSGIKEVLWNKMESIHRRVENVITIVTEIL